VHNHGFDAPYLNIAICFSSTTQRVVRQRPSRSHSRAAQARRRSVSRSYSHLCFNRYESYHTSNTLTLHHTRHLTLTLPCPFYPTESGVCRPHPRLHSQLKKKCPNSGALPAPIHPLSTAHAYQFVRTDSNITHRLTLLHFPPPHDARLDAATPVVVKSGRPLSSREWREPQVVVYLTQHPPFSTQLTTHAPTLRPHTRTHTELFVLTY
jgi:hypothetical protein